MPQRWFVDTSFVIALVSTRDNYHDVANALSERIERDAIELVTTDAIILEIGAALSKVAYRSAGIELIDSLRHDPHVEIVHLEAHLLDRAVGSFALHRDKEWSLADCVSFEVMRDRGMNEALSTDVHFEQAGFAALLRHH